jgi:hypothetical protein
MPFTLAFNPLFPQLFDLKVCVGDELRIRGLTMSVSFGEIGMNSTQILAVLKM